MTITPPARRPAFAATLLAAAIGSVAGAADRGDDEDRARLLGALQLTRLDVAFEEVPARDAIDRLARALGVPIRGRFLDDRAGHGIDPDAPITFSATDTDGLTALEMTLEQCELYEPCTWQLRRGFVEVGTKERLGVPAAAERRVHPIRDFLLEPPYFARLSGPGGGGGSGMTTSSLAAIIDASPYGGAVLSRPAGQNESKRPEVLALEMVTAIVQTIEPGNWDYGQLDLEDDPEAVERPSHRRPGRDAATRVATTKLATIRVLRGNVIITAPDFVHREVDGYPEPLPPPPLTDDERRERSETASGPGASIHVRPSGADGTRRR